MVEFRHLSVGQLVEVVFPRGGSMSGRILEVHLELAEHPWILVEQGSGAKTTIYQDEIAILDTGIG